jgi:hypothetical protein
VRHCISIAPLTQLLDRLAPLTTTGVGSLPFANPAQAARHAHAAYGLPFCPQLPRRDGDMVQEWLGADPRHWRRMPERNRRRPAAWDSLIALLVAQPPDHRILKLQVTGPVTLAVALQRHGGQTVTEPDVLPLARDISRWLAANAAGLVGRLAQIGIDVLLVVDEPGLEHANLDGGATGLWDPLASVAPAWGMHICGPVPWRLVDQLRLDLLSLDVARYALTRASRLPLQRLLGRGGRIAWGVLDAADPKSAINAALVAGACISEMACERLTPQRVAALSLLTASCGTGRLSGTRERLVATALDAAAHRTRLAIAASLPTVGERALQAS